MTTTQAKSTPVPAILVYGTPSGPALTQASWFRAEDQEAVKAAAEALKFSVIELRTDADKALAAGAHEGVLKGSGCPRLIPAGERRRGHDETRVRTKHEHYRPRPIVDRRIRPRQRAQSL